MCVRVCLQLHPDMSFVCALMFRRFRSGYAFLALIDKYKEGLVDYQKHIDVSEEGDGGDGGDNDGGGDGENETWCSHQTRACRTKIRARSLKRRFVWRKSRWACRRCSTPTTS